MAIFITAVLAGYIFLTSFWKRIFLVVCAVLIAMFKNGIRILTLSLLGNYVDPRILQSSLHREGGIPFFIVALVLTGADFILPDQIGKEEKNNE